MGNERAETKETVRALNVVKWMMSLAEMVSGEVHAGEKKRWAVNHYPSD